MKHFTFRFLLIIALLSSYHSIFCQAPDLGASSTFALFTASGAFNGDAAANVVGDIGTNVGAFTPPGFLVGSIHVSDPVSVQAAADVAIAYGYLDGLTCGLVLATPFGNNQTLSPNIYCLGSASVLNANLTLDGGGDPGAIFIFQIDGALTTNAGSNILLTNGASLCNVYWQVNGAFNHNGTLLQGTVLAAGAINLNAGASFDGRGLSTQGAISTSGNSVTLVNACLCSLEVVCPNPVGGTYSCISNIPAGVAADVTVISACGTPTVATTEASTGSGCTLSPYVLTRTYTVTDQGGHSTSCAVIYTAIDLTAPILTCPAGVSVSCASNVPSPAPTTVISSDLCGSPVTVIHSGDLLTAGTCANRFSISRTYRATDLCGNSASCSQTITVNDVTPPILNCPINVSVSCASNVPATTPLPTATDLCGSPVVVVLLGELLTSGTCANRFSLARSYQATDLCGNSTSCLQTITVNDVTPPILNCPINASVSCAANVPATTPLPTATDLCGSPVAVVLLGEVLTPGQCANRFSIARTYQATDLCGNSTSCLQTITVNDVAAPILNCPINVNVSCAANVPAPAALPTATDLCGSPVAVVYLGEILTPGTCANRFSLARSYQATDLCGNATVCTQTITVNDVSAPIINCPLNISVSCASNVPASTLFPTATDLCGSPVTVVYIGDVLTTGICANRFSIARSYQATDLCGNAASCVQTISVNDVLPPTFINPPSDITVECFLIPPAPPLPIASDNCSGIVTVILLSEIQTPGICPVLYTLTRIWRASDACGNSATTSQLLTVVDTQAPQFVIIPATVVMACDLASNENAYQAWLNNHGGATVFDCSPIVWTTTPSPFFTMPSECGGTSQRFMRFIATDQCGNSTFHDAGFTIMDMTPPVFDLLPQNLTVECIAGDQGEGQFIDWYEHFGYASASDKCGSVYTEMELIFDKKNCGSTFTRIYEFRATDECGNTNFVTATFAIVDNTAPVILKCPESNVFLNCVFDIPAADTAGVIASDACGGPIKVTLLSTFTQGVGCAYWPLTSAYTYAVTDLCGNQSTCIQSFQVIDSIAPAYTGPDTIKVVCLADLPGLGEVSGILAPYYVDNCYHIICENEGITETGVNWITFCVKAKDLCANWTEKFKITFVATGGCKPICTLPQDNWGDPGVAINGMLTTDAITQLINKYGPVSAGRFGKTIKVSSANCLQIMLPGSGNTASLGQGNFEFGASNECQLTSPLLNINGSLKNKLLANVLAMQLNIWYNIEFNERDLGVQALALLPTYLVDSVVISRLETDAHSVQGLLNLSNTYLAALESYPPNFGARLSDALENLNNYWKNCQINIPPSINTSVAGKLKTESHDGLDGGHIKLEGLNAAGSALSLVAQSDETGFYEFSNSVPISGTYTLTPVSSPTGSLNGVTTYDLVLISKHILGLELFNSPYKMIAADVNNSGTVTTFDVVELRKLILGIYNVLPDNKPWRFVDKAFVFSDPANPFTTPFPEYKTVDSIQSSKMEEDFVSVKIGDVNGTAVANQFMSASERTTGVLLFDVDNRQVNAEDIFEVRMSADQAVQCYQFTLITDGLELLDVSGKNMNAGNFAVFAPNAFAPGQSGALTTSWNVPEGAAAEFAAFSLKFRALRAGELREMLHISNQITTVEAYKTSKASKIPLSVALRFHDTNGSNISGLGFELYQNVPNPFVDKTTIGFYLPEASPATLSIYDETGRLVHSQKGDFGQGYNAFAVDKKLLTNSGSLRYKLETPDDVATKQMIQIK